jgi:hypothetical protein
VTAAASAAIRSMRPIARPGISAMSTRRALVETRCQTREKLVRESPHVELSVAYADGSDLGGELPIPMIALAFDAVKH